MTTVEVACTACGAEYETAVRPQVVEALRRCGECGEPALTVRESRDANDGRPPVEVRFPR